MWHVEQFQHLKEICHKHVTLWHPYLTSLWHLSDITLWYQHVSSLWYHSDIQIMSHLWCQHVRSLWYRSDIQMMSWVDWDVQLFVLYNLFPNLIYHQCAIAHIFGCGHTTATRRECVSEHISPICGGETATILKTCVWKKVLSMTVQYYAFSLLLLC